MPCFEQNTSDGSGFLHSERLTWTGWLSRLHKPGGNEQKYPERMKEHLAWTGGKVFTRFPPEPFGSLGLLQATQRDGEYAG
jgi:hypothetical protein